MSNFEDLKKAKLITIEIEEEEEYIKALNGLNPKLVQELIKARNGLNFEILRSAGLTTKAIEGDEAFQEELNGLPIELVLEIVRAVDDLVDDGGQDFS